jgi:hypothetical protein
MTSRDSLGGHEAAVGPDSIDNPDIRPDSIDNLDVRPDSTQGIIVDFRPEPGGDSGIIINWRPWLLPIVLVGGTVIAIGAFSFLGQPAASPAATGVPEATQQPGGVSAADTANLVVSGAAVNGSWTLKGGADVSATTEIMAAVWSEVSTDPSGDFVDFVTLSLSGPTEPGTVETSAAGLVLGLSIMRANADGSEQYTHVFASRGGECQVTLERTAAGVAGTFDCEAVRDADGHSADVRGSFAT